MALQGTDIASHYRHQADTLGRMAARYRDLAQTLDKEVAELDEKIRIARRELAAVYLDELTDAAFARTARLTGFKGFERRDPRAAIAHERKVLEHSIAQIESTESFARRQDLVGPVGTLTQELDNARTTLEPLDLECQRFETQLGFNELVDIGYDTPSFSEKWWQASYWKHWAAGDRICKALDLSDFGDDVLPAYKKVAEPRNFMRDEMKRIRAAIDAVHEQVKQRDQAQERLTNLEPIYLAEAQDYLGEHLQGADAALLEQWAAAAPDLVRSVQIGVRKLAGLTAKKQFLVDISQRGITEFVQQLGQKRQKAQAKANKFSRPKYAYASFNNNMIRNDFDQKAAALEQQRDKLDRRTKALIAAENYAGFDMRNDQELWWLYFMQSPPPRLAPGLFDYYQRRPNAEAITDPDYADMGTTPGEAMAVAFVAGDLEQGTYLS
jgi:hypothetical protein